MENLSDQMGQLAVKLTRRQQMEKDCEEVLMRKGIQVGQTIFPSSGEHGTESIGTVMVKANVFDVKMTKKVPVYQYQIEAAQMERIHRPDPQPDHQPDRPRPDTQPERPRRRHIDLIAPLATEQFRKNNRMELARKCFALVLTHCPDARAIRECSYYDGQAILFTLAKLPSDQITLEVRREVDLEGFYHADPEADIIRFRMSYTDNNPLILGAIPDVHEHSVQQLNEYRPLAQFVNIATSANSVRTGEHIVLRNGQCFLLHPENHQLVPDNLASLPPGIYHGIGTRKATRITEGPTPNSARPTLVIKPLAKPFHKVESVSAKVFGLFRDFENNPNGSLEAVRSMLTDVFVLPIHRPEDSRLIKIAGVTSANAHECEFLYGETSITVFDYHANVLGIQLQHPRLPLLISENIRRGPDSRIISRQESYHPMELYEVADNQPVSGDLALSLAPQTININCVVPRVFEDNTRKHVRAFNFQQSTDLNNAGLRVDENFPEIKARILQPPAMIYGNDHVSTLDAGTSTWRASGYIIPAKINVWAVYQWVPSKMPNLTPDEFDKFVGQFIRECLNRGIQIGAPAEQRTLQVGFNGNSYAELQGVFQAAKRSECEFILLLTNITDKEVHPRLKMCECETGILTQNVTIETAKKFINPVSGRLTIENVVNKTNEKCGGSNYFIGDLADKSCLGDKDLFVGFVVNKLPRKEGSIPPAVLGYAANDRQNLISFCGNYVYQEARISTIFSALEDIVRETLNRFHTNRGIHPDRVFLFMNGYQEGQFEHLMKYPVPLVRKTIEEICGAKLVLIVPNLRHGVRIWPANLPSDVPPKARAQNVLPGTVVDTNIVSPVAPEFYMVSHRASKGTSTPPRYVVICNDAGLKIDEIQRTTLYLCFAHQIINSPIGLPAPVFVALEMAKRGRANLLLHSTTSSSSGSQENHQEENEFAHWNNTLSYRNNPLRGQRFNA